MPKITVLLPAYNNEDYIAQSLESIINQTYSDIEILIINDGSTDNTRNIISSFQDSRICVIDNDKNIGLTRSLNKGLLLAKGDFIARQDADDLSEPQRLEKQIDFLEKHSDIVFVGTGYQEIDGHGNILGEYTLPSRNKEICWGLLFYTPFIHSSVMFNRETILQNVGLYNERYQYSQDHELWTRIARSYPMANLHEHLVKYRVHDSSITLFHGSRQYELLMESCNSYMTFFLTQGNEWQQKRVVDERCFYSIQYLLGYSQNKGLEKISHEILKEAIQTIFDLHEAFFAYYHKRFSTLDKQEHDISLKDVITRKLVDLALDNLPLNPKEAVDFLYFAYRLKRKILFKRFFQSALIRVVFGIFNWNLRSTWPC